MVRFRKRRNIGLMREADPWCRGGDGGNLRTFQMLIACASGADRFKVELQLDKCGLMPYFSGVTLILRKATAP